MGAGDFSGDGLAIAEVVGARFSVRERAVMASVGGVDVVVGALLSLVSLLGFLSCLVDIIAMERDDKK